MSYIVTSGFDDLDGTCEITGNEITSYHSKKLGDAKSIEQLGGPDLHCRVTFKGGTDEFKYHIHAHLSGSGYRGHARDKNDDPDTEETWAATATMQPAVAAKGTT